ncbi:MFS transporter [Vulcanisaeta thermophila]|uniref:MFS transporter n=1 Tax=Vulcanisaeta thermophila TaxID=867917 RepID=UPI000852A7F2|nr:MFS transporter [Vulcanisaeta thermophila]
MRPSNLRDAYKVAISANLGWGFELYDMLTYVYATPYFAPLFFPSGNYIASVLAALLTLVLGYFARPIGAVILGHLGDRLGRKTTWFMSLLGMGIATTLIGFLPTYYQVGIAATILLALLRITQGIFLAGEWAGGMTITVEFAPTARMRGFLGGISQSGAAVASLFGAAALALTSALAPTKAAMESYGWRIIFWFGVIPLIIALIVRWKISESKPWLVKAKPNPERIPIAALLRKYGLFVLIAVLVIFGESLIYYGSIGYFGTLIPLLGYSREFVIYASLAAGLSWLIIAPFFGMLSDRLGMRKYLLLILYLIDAALLYPVWYLVTLHNTLTFILGTVLMGILFGSQYSILPAWLGENIETRVRYSGIGFIINLGVALSSFAPYISTYLLSTVGKVNPVLAISLVTIIGAIIAAVFVALSPRDNITDELS